MPLLDRLVPRLPPDFAEREAVGRGAWASATSTYSSMARIAARRSVPCTSNPQVRCMYTPVKAQASERFVQVAAARNGTCAIGRTSRKVFCWGTDGFVLAQGVGGPVYVPTQIVEPVS